VTYGSREELHELVEHFLAAPDERAARGAAGRAIVLGQHTFAHRVDRLLELVGQLRDDDGVGAGRQLAAA
jgi:spore maturation protein CgeB